MNDRPTFRVYIDDNVMPNWSGPQQPYLMWPGGEDDLVRFIYANQGPLFIEDAVLFNHWTPERDDHYVISRDIGRRILGTWEQTLLRSLTPKAYSLTPEDVQTIETALEDMADRIDAQQSATHDYTPNELRDVRRRRSAVRRALQLDKED